MKFIKEITSRGLLLPLVAARLAKFKAGDKVEYRPLKGTMVVLKKRMTALELLTAVEQLQGVASELLFHLHQVCGPCEECEDGCLCGETEDSPLQHLPTDLLLTFAEAGTCLGELEEYLITEDIVYGK
ncbi:hypothetical protein [Flintibacter muris]|uniref:hypothetical protein n=1 Tax=Flintibacter muris TaxID=2941327 RepID=UPI0020406EBF|nr:hypothetical protein [Flintibacter muris]